MDISTTIEPKSDQQNYEDYLAGPRTVTITEVRKGSREQPVELHLAEYPGRPYKPSKSMRRVLVYAWGKEASAYVGRQLTLYGDPDVKFGGEPVGGIKISHMSHLREPFKIALTVTRGKRATHEVQRLETRQPAIPAPSAQDVSAATDLDELRDMFRRATPDVQRLIRERVAELQEPQS